MFQDFSAKKPRKMTFALALKLLFINVLHCTASPEDGAKVEDKPFYSSTVFSEQTLTITYI